MSNEMLTAEIKTRVQPSIKKAFEQLKKSTIPVTVYNWMKSLSFQFCKIDTDKYLIANISYPGSLTTVFSKGDACILLFQDQTTISIPFRHENGKTVSVGTYIKSAGVTSYSNFYTLNDSIINKFRNKELTGIRFYSSDSYFEFLVNDKKNKKKENIYKFFNEDIKCIN